jgi:hypothetical protein
MPPDLQAQKNKSDFRLPDYQINKPFDPKYRQQLFQAADAARARDVLALARQMNIKEEYIVEQFLQRSIPLKAPTSQVLNDILDNKYLNIANQETEDRIWILLLIYMGTNDRVILYWLFRMLLALSGRYEFYEYTAKYEYTKTEWLNTRAAGGSKSKRKQKQ